MKFDEELYKLITQEVKKGGDIFELLAVIGNHMTMMIQCLNSTKELKISLARQVITCVIEELEKDPHPLRSKLN